MKFVTFACEECPRKCEIIIEDPDNSDVKDLEPVGCTYEDQRYDWKNILISEEL